MNGAELKYTLISIGLLGASTYAFFLSKIIFGFPLALLGIYFGIKSTNKGKPDWKIGIVTALVGLLLGYIATAIFVKSITG